MEAVRFGLRMAFSRASTPGMPRERGRWASPMTLATGRAMTGPEHGDRRGR